MCLSLCLCAWKAAEKTRNAILKSRRTFIFTAWKNTEISLNVASTRRAAISASVFEGLKVLTKPINSGRIRLCFCSRFKVFTFS